MMLTAYLKESGAELPHMKRVVIGGSAVPEAMIRSFEQNYDVQVIHAWGMTETSPLGTLNFLLPHLRELDYEAQMETNLNRVKLYSVLIYVLSMIVTIRFRTMAKLLANYRHGVIGLPLVTMVKNHQ